MKTIHRLSVLSSLLLCLLSVLPAGAQSRYADHSVLSAGKWVKVRVPQTGVYQLTDEFLLQAGFSDPSHVKVFGYGGALQPEKLTADYLTQTDDLHEVPQYRADGLRLFHAIGPVNWESAAATKRQRNSYSQYGYYFLTTSEEEPLTQDSTAFADAFYPSNDDYHSLYEVDDFAWFHGGRQLYDHNLFGQGQSYSYRLPAYASTGVLTVVMSYDGYVTASVSVNGTRVGNIVVDASTTKAPERRAYIDQYSRAAVDTWTFQLRDMLQEENTITITQQTSGTNMRLDYIQLAFDSPKPMPALSGTAFPQPELVGPVACQDLHADGPADMVIIIPSSRKVQSEAERLARLHEEKDGLTVRVVTADELYNEFSSGTPDANAYRRYMKMLYDRATTPDEKPRYLLLMGDAAWDNRMLVSDWSTTSPDDYLLSYESENSMSETECYVTDDYFTLLDDDEGTDIVKRDMGDMAVGRLLAHDDAEAHILVDKIYSYTNNEEPGDWQNTICIMADDGNKNMHMEAADTIANLLDRIAPEFRINKIYWDAYTRVISSRGESYPEVTKLIKQQMHEGALLMNYVGHGAANSISHELVLLLADFAEATSMRLPVWFTASCDIMPFDAQGTSIGETAMMNPMGGAIAFYGTTRTVYADYNKVMNKAFVNHLFSTKDNGEPVTIGEAVRLAKNELMIDMINNKKDMKKNCLHFNLLGDPALKLARPTLRANIDEVNGSPLAGNQLSMPSGTVVTVNGHIEGDDSFNGITYVTFCDAEKTIVCHVNNTSKDDKPKEAFRFTDRSSVIFRGMASVVNGQFEFSFAIPKDVSYDENPGHFYCYAVNSDHSLMANGHNEGFVIVSADSYPDEGVGPTLTCYLDNMPLSDGMSVGSSPYFYAEIADPDGLNVSGQGIGHDMELVIDGQMALTYVLNSSFLYNLGDYRSGTVGYYLPTLEPGEHRLFFRAWDVLNNSSSVSCTIMVNASGITADIISMPDTQRPAPDAQLYDASGRRVRPAANGIYIQRDTKGDHRKLIITHK